MTTRYDIQETCKNPSAPDVINAFTRAFDDTERPWLLTFHAIPMASGASVRELQVRVTGLEYESGSPGMFCIKGYLRVGQNEMSMQCFYNANTRAGHLEIEGS